MKKKEGKNTRTHGFTLGLVLPREDVIGAATHCEYLHHRIQCQLYCISIFILPIRRRRFLLLLLMPHNAATALSLSIILAISEHVSRQCSSTTLSIPQMGLIVFVDLCCWWRWRWRKKFISFANKNTISASVIEALQNWLFQQHVMVGRGGDPSYCTDCWTQHISLSLSLCLCKSKNTKMKTKTKTMKRE